MKSVALLCSRACFTRTGASDVTASGPEFGPELEEVLLLLRRLSRAKADLSAQLGRSARPIGIKRVL